MSLKTVSIGIWQRLLLSCMLVLLSAGAYAQATLTVRGSVLDADTREPMIGVSVMEKGTANGAITNIDGQFVLQGVRRDATIVFSYIGYQDLELAAGRIGSLRPH